ncbi:MAG TPA: tetratricopeptide repeat protein [Oceanipulchritudo sp.]|nr:tetratricopeptide repeat protein [Oceanipulchritudo sp.]
MPLTLSALLIASPLSTYGVLPLRDQWQAACRAMAVGQAEQAMGLLGEFDAWYADEPAVRDPAFREGYLRLKGLTALQTGRIEEGIGLLESWLEEYPDHPRYRAFIRFQVASGQRARGETDAAIRHWQVFLQAHPELPECALVHWMWADLLMAGEAYEQARPHLMAVLEETRLPPSGNALARSALALVDLHCGNRQQTVDWLRPGSAEASPVLSLWRALLAPSLAQQLLEEEQVDQAAEVAGWFDRPQSLAQRLPPLPSSNKASPQGARQAIWSSHWSMQLQRLRSALEGSGPDSIQISSLYALRLRILLRAKAADQAEILATGLLQSSAEELRDIRATAYGAAIEASHLLKDWSRAEELAAEFALAYPGDPDLPRILFLQAQTAAGRKDLASAISQADRLITTCPEHAARPGWEIVAAGWRLEAGRAAEALSVFDSLATTAPASWQPFLRFQQARCQEALKETDVAIALYTEVSETDTANQALREQAVAGLLKIHLGKWHWAEFDRMVAHYHKTWPDGMNRLMIENQAATAYLQRGDTVQAVLLFEKIAAEDSPLATYAHEQLSAIHRQSPNPEILRTHAIAWIRQGLANGKELPETPFLDCRLYQRQCSKPALPDGLLPSLMEVLELRPGCFPAPPFLDMLEDQWASYSDLLQADSSSFADWIRSAATNFLISDKRAPFAAFQLHGALLLERQGRPDSADALRIEVLQAVDPEFLDAVGLMVIASTATRYDFPEAQELLQSVLIRYPDSDQRPEVLFLLARLLRNSEESAKAFPLLEEVLSDWPDAPIHNEACLELAGWLVEDGRHPEALATLGVLLEKPGLAPLQAAQALVLRAEADFKSGAMERGLLDCQRVLTLYPAFGDIANATATLLLAHLPNQPEETRQLILSAIPDFPLPPNA